ncbi:hypothetical protein N9140_01025 [bacterium]|nr:hypothetical protein [bacterium]
MKLGIIVFRRTNGSSQSDIAVHPLLLKKAWVQVESDKAVIKIMHRLREKDKKDKTGDWENEEWYKQCNT